MRWFDSEREDQARLPRSMPKTVPEYVAELPSVLPSNGETTRTARTLHRNLRPCYSIIIQGSFRPYILIVFDMKLCYVAKQCPWCHFTRKGFSRIIYLGVQLRRRTPKIVTTSDRVNYSFHLQGTPPLNHKLLGPGRPLTIRIHEVS